MRSYLEDQWTSDDDWKIRAAVNDTVATLESADGKTHALIHSWNGEVRDLSMSPITTLNQLKERVERIFRVVGTTPDVVASVKEVLKAHHKTSRGMIYHGDQLVSWKVSEFLP